MDNITELSRDMARDDCKSINVKKNGKWKEFVAIVRCRDCKWHENVHCANFKDDFYCAWGEKREDDVDT